MKSSNFIFSLSIIIFIVAVSPAHTQCPPAYIFSGEAAGDLLGLSVASAGDVKDDGFDDLIVGAYVNDADGIDAREAYISSDHSDDLIGAVDAASQSSYTCVRLSIDGGDCTPPGIVTDVSINIETNDSVGGFDILISYDASVLAFMLSEIDVGEIDGWEYFAYRLNSAGCGAFCPSGLVRFIGIADISNGDLHPPDSTLMPNGQLINITFVVANNQNIAGQFIPINFVSYDCGDNAFSNPGGTILFVINRIYNAGQVLIWDEGDDVNFPDSLRPYGLGVDDSCLVGGLATATRCIDFVNGGICVSTPPDTSFVCADPNGDELVNFDDVDFLIDYYFYSGTSPVSLVASDLNCDGSVNIADITYLAAYINGIGAAPCCQQ